jgi:hypothetical protein
MTDVKAHKEWLEMRNNVRRAVQSLELCWKCQKVSECQKYVLGQTVLVWLCKECMVEMEKPLPERLKSRSRAATTRTTVTGPTETFQ